MPDTKKKRTIRILRSILCLFAVGALAGLGCASVEPWEKQAFTRPSMQVDGDPMGDLLREHLYFSREAASGGETVGGGGCGCN